MIFYVIFHTVDTVLGCGLPFNNAQGILSSAGAEIGSIWQQTVTRRDTRGHATHFPSIWYCPRDACCQVNYRSWPGLHILFLFLFTAALNIIPIQTVQQSLQRRADARRDSIQSGCCKGLHIQRLSHWERGVFEWSGCSAQPESPSSHQGFPSPSICLSRHS